MIPTAAMVEVPPARPLRELWQTAKGPLWIERNVTAEAIAALAVDPGIGIFGRYRPEAPAQQKLTLLRVAGMPDGNAVLAYDAAGLIVGYICLSAPGADERWGGPEFPFVHEFGLIEVSRNWRGIGLAEKLMSVAFHDDALEDKIVVSTSYAWHWDLAESHLSKWQYRIRLQALLSRYRFIMLATDEENIMYDPANLLTARFGSRVPEEAVARFSQTLFRYS